MDILDVQLAQLEKAQLVRRSGDDDLSFQFRHSLTQETAYDSLLVKKRREIHRRVAQAIEGLYPNRLDNYAAVLAAHYAEAGDEDKTLEYATRAGDQSARVYANAEALAHYSQALALARRLTGNSGQVIQLYSHRGRALELMGEYDKALANYADMHALALERGDRAMELSALEARATIVSTPTARFNPAEARELSRGSLTLARELKDRASEAKILWNLMLLAHFSGHFDEAIAFGEQSIALARELGLREQLAYSLNDIGRPYMAAGQFDRGVAALQEAQPLWHALDNKPMLADNLNTQGTAALFLGHYDRTLDLCGQAYRLGHSIGNAWTQAHSLMNPSLIHLERGEIETALAMGEECLRLGQQVGFFVAVANMRVMLAVAYSTLGDMPRAFEFVRMNRPPREKAGAWEATILGVLAQLHVRTGELNRAEELVKSSYMGLKDAPPNPIPNFSTFTADAELALAKRDYARAAQVADQIHDRMPRNTPPFYRISWLHLRGRILHGEGRTAEAKEVLNRARMESEKLGSRFFLWRILALMAELDPSAAPVYSAEAGATIEFIADHSPAALRESFLNQDEVRRVLNGRKRSS